MKRKDKTIVVGAALIGLATVGTVAITKGIGKAIMKGAGFVGNKVLGDKDLLTVKKKFDEEEFEEVDDNIEEIVEEKIEEVVNEEVQKEIVNEEDEAIKQAQEEMKTTIAEAAKVTRRQRKQQ